MQRIFEAYLATNHPELSSPILSQIDRALKIKLLCNFKNMDELSGLEMWLSKYLREEILGYIGIWFKELKELLEFVFKTDFTNWSTLLNRENSKRQELEIITQALGEENKKVREKSDKLMEKNSVRINYETMNQNLDN
jgi:hypothetical protein